VFFALTLNLVHQLVKTIDIIFYNFKPRRNKMRALFLLAILVSCALLIHTAYATASVGGLSAAKQEKISLEYYAVPVFLGVFTFQSNDPVENLQPSISTSYGTSMGLNSTSTTSNETAAWLAQFSPFTPQNAYATFVSQLNQTVQAIFWGQFNYTEQKTNDGLAAMNQVEQNGGNASQAREAFIENATASRSDITTVNNNLNVQYAHANSTVQAEFDKYGNMP
jgi:hypothetical protein